MSPPRLFSSACVIVSLSICGCCAGPPAEDSGAHESEPPAAEESPAERQHTVADNPPHSEPTIPLDGTPWIIDMIPKNQSGESEQDSEAFLAIHPKHPNILVGTAFTHGLTNNLIAPIYESTDWGASWTLVDAIPRTFLTGDITVAFHPEGVDNDELRAASLRPDSNVGGEYCLFELVAPGVPLGAPMTEINTSRRADQPFLCVPNDGRWLVAQNDWESLPGPALDRNPGTGSLWQTESIDPNTQVPVAPASVRVVSAIDGWAYAAYFRNRPVAPGANPNADVIVKRDANPNDASFFEDPIGAGGAKEVVVDSAYLAFQGDLGQQELGTTLSLAVDPKNSQIVWIAWADSDGSSSTLYISRSSDAGVTWTKEPQAKMNTINAALAIAGDGTVGLLYQRFVGNNSGGQWETHLERNSGAGWSDVILARFDPLAVSLVWQPFLGDYACLLAYGSDFHGVFCSSNGGDFPVGVTWQRVHPPGTGAPFDAQRTPVNVSIDPFYFRARSHP